MLETPTFGRFYGENKFLVFEPAQIYTNLVYACIAGGAAAVVYGSVLKPLTGNPEMGWWWTFTGFLVCLAGIWANISLVRIRFNIGERSYRRRQGPGFIPKLWQGSVDGLDAIQVIAEHTRITGIAGLSVKYYMVLHWKGKMAPPMVLETEVYDLMPGSPIQAHAQKILGRAQMFGRALQLPVFDNTHFHSPCPVDLL